MAKFDGSRTAEHLQQMRDGGYLSDAIMREAVKQLKAADARYNFVGVYMLNPAENVLWLHNYAGEPTEHARIRVGEGVCGTAVATQANQNVADVTKVDNYISCSPRTRSELVVLIRKGEEIFGQIDIDARELAAFTPDDQRAVEAVADKIADAIVKERADEEELRRVQRRQAEPSVQGSEA